MSRHSEDEHPQVVIDRLHANQPTPPHIDHLLSELPPEHVTDVHRRVAAGLHERRTADHLLRVEAWKRTLADEESRLAKLIEKENVDE